MVANPAIRTVVLLCSQLLLGLLSAQGQTTAIRGTVLDGGSGAPLPFANIYAARTETGTIADVEGQFRISGIGSDEKLQFSFIGYETITLTAYDSMVVNLKPKQNLLSEVVVMANNELLYTLLWKVRETASRQTDTLPSYLFLETFVDSVRTELLELYYNGVYRGYDVAELRMKTGRLGLQKWNNGYFISTDISKAINGQLLFVPQAAFPTNPFQLGRQKLKRSYDLSLDGINRSADGGNVYIISFSPRDQRNDMFAGKAWIDSASNALIKVKFEVENASVYPFVPLWPDDGLEKVNLSITRTFDVRDGNYRLNSIDFAYDFSYLSIRDSVQRKQSVVSYAVLKPSWKRQPFLMPFPTEGLKHLSDYRNLSALPKNEGFWQQSRPFSLVDQNAERSRFLQTSMNELNDVAKDHHAFDDGRFFEASHMFWSGEKRIRFAEFSPDKRSRKLSEMPNEKFHLNAFILMDPWRINDSIQFRTFAMFDPYESFFHLPVTCSAQIFINMYFDLVEIQRRELDQELRSKRLSMDDARSLHRQHQTMLQKTLHQFVSETAHGTNKEAMVRWNQSVLEKLGVDNLGSFNCPELEQQ
ncbi:MAG: hypothetical protein GC178_07535 [Flavobacteriales bacterium]|nr:hypothetical protein [Flavobacteriales bacterium]